MTDVTTDVIHRSTVELKGGGGKGRGAFSIRVISVIYISCSSVNLAVNSLREIAFRIVRVGGFPASLVGRHCAFRDRLCLGRGFVLSVQVRAYRHMTNYLSLVHESDVCVRACVNLIKLSFTP